MEIRPLQVALAQECKTLEEANGDLSTAFSELSTYADQLEVQIQEAGPAEEAAAARPAEEVTADSSSSAPRWQGVILDYNPWGDLFFSCGTPSRTLLGSEVHQ